MIIIYDKPSTHTVPLKSNAFTLFPGKNHITDQQLKDYEKEYKFDFDALFAEGLLKIISESDDATIKSFTEKDAMELIENTLNVKELESYKKEEIKKNPRQRVLNAIDAMIDAINNIGKDKKK